ncbi:phage tail assembly protein [Methylocystis parvus]|uniref:phage tail assembly protein n=1 Tax=Methylocystis parvus TaxID=134 RepID=UPI003C722DD5
MTDIVSTIKLAKPIQTHKGAVDTLELKEPTARLYVAHGSPFEITTKDNQVSFVYNDKATMAFAAEMTGHDEIILGALAARDWLKLRTKITDVILGVLGTDGPFELQNG